MRRLINLLRHNLRFQFSPSLGLERRKIRDEYYEIFDNYLIVGPMQFHWWSRT